MKLSYSLAAKFSCIIFLSLLFSANIQANGRWTKKEITRLENLVDKFDKDWGKISGKMKDRSAEACHAKWRRVKKQKSSRRKQRSDSYRRYEKSAMNKELRELNKNVRREKRKRQRSDIDVLDLNISIPDQFYSTPINPSSINR